MLFAVGYKFFGSDGDAKTYDIRAVYWEQALITTGTTALALALAWILVGPWAGCSPGALVGTYPPLIGATGDQLSEPLGAFLLLAAFVALALALKRRPGRGSSRAAGALFGLTILTRTDLLPVPFLIAGLGGLIALIQTRSRRAIAPCALAGDAAVVVLAPWTIYASARGGPVHPRDQGQRGGAVRRHLPAGRRDDDRDEGAPRDAAARRSTPSTTGSRPTRSRPPTRSSSSPPSTRSSRATRRSTGRPSKNLIHYSTTQPVAFAKMQWAKAKRMWFFYYRGGGVHYISTPMRIWQVVLVLAGGLGLLAGLIRRRDPCSARSLITLAFSTLDPHDRGLPGPLQRPADAAADRRRRRGLVPRPARAPPGRPEPRCHAA